MTAQDVTKEELIDQIEVLKKRISEIEGLEADRISQVSLLKESKRMLHSLLQYSPDPMVVYDAEGRVLLVNSAFTARFGWTNKELWGRRIDYVPEEFLAQTKDSLERSFRGELVPPFDTKRLTKDGEVLDIHISSALFRDDEGKPAGHIVTLRDITEKKQTNEKLRESKQLHQALFESLAEGVILQDSQHVIRSYNSAAEDILGLPADKVINRSYFDIPWSCIREDRTPYPVEEHPCTVTLQTGTPFSHVIMGIQQHERIIWISINTRPLIREGQNMPYGVVTSFSDSTERMRMEDALKESEEWYRTLVEESFDGIFVQKGSQIVFANSRLYEMLGYSDGELEGMDHWKVYHPDYQKMTRERAVARMRGEDLVSQYEVKLQRKDGTSFDGEIRVKAVNLKGEPGVTVWIRDVSKRKHSEEVQRRLATAVEQAVETIVITDPEGRIQYVNPAFERITGYTRAEAIGRNPSILKSGEHDQIFYKNLWDTIKRGDVWTGRFVNRKKDGSLYHEDAAISPVRDAGGKIINYVSVKRDITEHLQLASQLLHAQKMEAIGTLAGGIAHDFNNLLQVSMGYSELLIQDSKEDDPRHADLLKIFQAAKSGAELVQRLLLFSRKVEPKPVPLNLNRQIMQVEKLLRRTIPKMIDIEIDLFADVAKINADPGQIEQVLMNLAVNARDAMPDGGKLTFCTRNVRLDEEYCKAHVGAHPGQYVLLTISDTGYGMDKATIEHIFEPFYTTKELGRGTGLGLAMVYGIVKQHKGYITCESRIGQGTTFGVYLPVIERQLEPRLEASGEFPAFGTETILLVDDEETVRQFGERILTKCGYTVLIAADGKEALDVYKEHKEQLALVILDLIMPKMGGKDCLKELLRNYPQMKVLISSGFSSAGSTGECIELGAKGFVAKPFRFKELLRQVRKALDES